MGYRIDVDSFEVVMYNVMGGACLCGCVGHSYYGGDAGFLLAVCYLVHTMRMTVALTSMGRTRKLGLLVSRGWNMWVWNIRRRMASSKFSLVWMSPPVVMAVLREPGDALSALCITSGDLGPVLGGPAGEGTAQSACPWLQLHVKPSSPHRK